MASMPHHIATYLDSVVPSLVFTNPGRNIFMGAFPPDPEVCIGLYQTTGTKAILAMKGGGNGVIVEQPGLQVMVRHSTSEGANALAYQIHDALNNFVGTLSGVRYLHIEARHPPGSLGVDEDKRFRFSLNFMIKKELG